MLAQAEFDHSKCRRLLAYLNQPHGALAPFCAASCWMQNGLRLISQRSNINLPGNRAAKFQSQLSAGLAGQHSIANPIANQNQAEQIFTKQQINRSTGAAGTRARGAAHGNENNRLAAHNNPRHKHESCDKSETRTATSTMA